MILKISSNLDDSVKADSQRRTNKEREGDVLSPFHAC